MRRGLALALAVIGLGWVFAGGSALISHRQHAEAEEQERQRSREEVVRQAEESIARARADLERDLSSLDERLAKAKQGLAKREQEQEAAIAELEAKIDELMAEKDEGRRVDAQLARAIRARDALKERSDPGRDRAKENVAQLEKDRDQKNAQLAGRIAEAEGQKVRGLEALAASPSAARSWHRPAIALAIGVVFSVLAVLLVLAGGAPARGNRFEARLEARERAASPEPVRPPPPAPPSSRIIVAPPPAPPPAARSEPRLNGGPGEESQSTHLDLQPPPELGADGQVTLDAPPELFAAGADTEAVDASSLPNASSASS
jgi:hypothetical protein